MPGAIVADNRLRGWRSESVAIAWTGPVAPAVITGCGVALVIVAAPAIAPLKVGKLTVRLLIVEALCAGLVPDAEAALFPEGRAMLSAIAGDFAKLPGVEVSIVWNHPQPRPASIAALPVVELPEPLRLSDPDNGLHPSTRPGDCPARSWDATLIIAPEIGGCLADLCRRSQQLAPRSLNTPAEVIAVCSDKLALAETLSQHGIPGIPTAAEDFTRPPCWDTAAPDDPFWVTADREPPMINPEPAAPPAGWVIKPRCGAGGWLARRVRTRADWEAAAADFGVQRLEGGSPRSAPSTTTGVAAVRQPFIPGVPLSLCGCFTPGHPPRLLPLGQQHIAWTPHCEYRGGTLPAAVPEAVHQRAAERVRQLGAVFPALTGWIGVDLLWETTPLQSPSPIRLQTASTIEPAVAPPVLRIVEINPRLTTSYLGYRLWATGSLAAAWLDPLQPLPGPPLAVSRSLTFTPTGDCPI